MNHNRINYNCFNEPFAASLCKYLCWDMHGLIFETSIWLLAGSTRLHDGANSWPKLTECSREDYNECSHALDKLELLKTIRSSAELNLITVYCNRRSSSHQNQFCRLRTMTNDCCLAQRSCGVSCHIVYQMRSTFKHLKHCRQMSSGVQ